MHFKDGQPTNENPDPTEDLGCDFNSKVVGGKQKNPLDRSKIMPEKKQKKKKKAKKSGGDLRTQNLQEQLKKAENELKILKEKLKKKGKKGLKCGYLKTDKEVNLLTGDPTWATFEALFDMVKKNVKKLRYLSGLVK